VEQTQVGRPNHDGRQPMIFYSCLTVTIALKLRPYSGIEMVAYGLSIDTDLDDLE